MREILFKAKRFDTREWIEGYFVQQKNNLGGIHSCIFQNFEKENRWEMKRVHLNTVCQYTGLTDKNGRKIFEGDILSAHLDDQYPEDITYVQVTWDGFSWCIRESMEDDVMTEHDCNVFEVCGNIFDNPELIGEQP